MDPGFKASLGCILRPCLQTNKIKQKSPCEVMSHPQKMAKINTTDKC